MGGIGETGSLGCPQTTGADQPNGCFEAAHWTAVTTSVPEPATLSLLGLGLAGGLHEAAQEKLTPTSIDTTTPARVPRSCFRPSVIAGRIKSTTIRADRRGMAASNGGSVPPLSALGCSG